MRRPRKFEACATAFLNCPAKISSSPSNLPVFTKEICVPEKVNMHTEKAEKNHSLSHYNLRLAITKFKMESQDFRKGKESLSCSTPIIPVNKVQIRIYNRLRNIIVVCLFLSKINPT